MFRFVAFLRGINVGGHIVVKEKLKEAFTSMGFQNVSTYKQSGNVIFKTDTANPQEIRAKTETKLHSTLGYEVAVFVRTIPQLKSIINLDPFKGQEKEGASFLVTFLSIAPSNFPLQLPLTIPKSTAQVISAKGTEVFSVTHDGGEGALPNPFLELKLKLKATTRNMNIIREIVEKYA
ncbi:MAG: DUF1697 domain-containing protein [Chloroflexi bacterium]|nr:DUF1697 domain-containing protein [Chloroflexota bacterium]MCL5950035.1 DUF1697 domain-containing protein [Candidatus Bathyarchaeota archaeon]